MDKQIKKISDVKAMLSELRDEICYFGGSEVLLAFDKVASEWGFDLDGSYNATDQARRGSAGPQPIKETNQ